MSVPTLVQAGWADYATHVAELSDQHLSLAQHAGSGIITLNANQGAPPVHAAQTIGLAMGSRPTSSDRTPKLWIEYRVPAGFDQHIDRPVSTNAFDLPPQGAILIHDVRHNGGDTLTSTLLGWIPAISGQTISLAPQPYEFRVIEARPSHRMVFLAVEERTWRAWFPIGYQPEFNQIIPVAAVSRSPKHVDLFKAGPEGAGWSSAWAESPKSSKWTDWFQIHPETVFAQEAPVAALARRSDQLNLFVTGLNGSVWSCWWHADPQGWRPWFPIVPSSTFSQDHPVSALARLPEHIDLFKAGPDGNVWSTWWATI